MDYLAGSVATLLGMVLGAWIQYRSSRSLPPVPTFHRKIIAFGGDKPEIKPEKVRIGV